MTTPNDNISRLEVVPVRTAFPKESHHFTTWLESHVDALADRLGLDLTVVQKEKPVGDFSLDLLCEDADGHRVIIENQLERTDHDHLGKVLTYLVNLDAKAAIWVTTESRPEHQKVIDWLNESTGDDLAFYLVKVEAVRIGQSPYAPLFTPLAEPDHQAKEIGKTKKELAGREQDCYEFWKSLLLRSRDKTPLFSNITPSHRGWISTQSGKAGIGLLYSIARNWGTVDLYIDHDKDSGAGNKATFDALYSQKDAIENEVGAPLTWERLDHRRACRVDVTLETGGLATPDKWPVLQDEMINIMIRLDKVMRPRLAKL